MVKFITPAMSSSSEYVPGSVEWVDRRAQALQDRFQSIQENGIRPFLLSLNELISSKPKPWDLWPPFPDGPARTIDRFCRVILHLGWPAICDLIASYDAKEAQRLRAKNAATEEDGVTRGGDHGNQYTGGKDGNTNLATKNTAAYLLRRLAREKPELLKAYERGEYPSARAAASAAGFVKPRATIPSDMTIDDLAAQLRRRFKDQSDRERLAELLLGSA